MVSASEIDINAFAQFAEDPRGPAPLTSPESILMSLSADSKENWLVTGGAGFIGANFILSCRAENRARVFNLDRLGSTGNQASFDRLRDDQDYLLIRGDIRNRILVQRVLHEYMPNAIIHFAAETPADHVFLSPESFMQTNVLGTFSLLEEARQYWESMDGSKRDQFRFLHVSSPEVYGTLEAGGKPFDETAPYNPSGLFAASKAACDHLVRVYGRTYGLPVLIVNSASCFGPYQFPYESIPRTILNALEGEKIPLFGNGTASRDWVYVQDLCAALRVVLERGLPGETYHVSAGWERTDHEMVRMVCAILDELRPDPRCGLRESLAAPLGGNTVRYPRFALGSEKIRRELGWRPRETLENAIRATVQWHLDSLWWVEAVRTGEYRNWMNRQHYERRTGTD